jgi:ribonuclease J
MWSGYLKNEDGVLVQTWFNDGGSRAEHIHSSGHASPSDLRAFARAMNPKQLVPVHGVAWDGNTDGFPCILRLADGETIAL